MNTDTYDLEPDACSMHPDEEMWDIEQARWEDALDAAVPEFLAVLRDHTGHPIDDPDVISDIRDEIRMAHEMDDPDWSFSATRCIDAILEVCANADIRIRRIDDQAYADLEADLDELLPVRPS